MNFKVICDSAADLEPEVVRRAGITVVPFYVSLDGVHYLKEGADIRPGELHKRMAEDPSCYPKTSMPAIADYAAVFSSAVKADQGVLCICLTQKFSGSYQSAMGAKKLVESEYPQARIVVMDSQLATGLQGVLVTEAVRLRDREIPLLEAVSKLEAIRATGRIFFTTNDLKYLHKGGRLNAAAYVAGSMLNMKPLLQCYEGDLTLQGVCRGQKRSLYRLTELLLDSLRQQQLDLQGYVFGTGVGLGFPEYENFIRMLEQKLGENGLHPSQWINMRIGAAIGVHTGPYPVGVGFMKLCDI